MNKELEQLTMEQAYAQLDSLLGEMENGEHSLEDTFRMYAKGIELVQACHEKIDAIEKKLQILEENGDTVDEY